MKLNQLSIKKIVLLNLGVIVGLFLVTPLLLDLIEINSRILLIMYLGTILLGILVVLMIFDISFLVIKKHNYYIFSIINMSITLLLFFLMIYSFLNNIYDIVYVMNYSNSTLPLIYKIVMIWAGEDGSIMTWMLFNSVIINLFRIKNQNKEDLVFIRSVIISLIISVVFTIILFSMNPFEVRSPPVWPNGNLTGSFDILLSPFMIWHPLFTFISYVSYSKNILYGYPTILP